MPYEFRPGVRNKTSVLVGFAGASGSGKTLSALKLATGLAGPNGKIAFIDTERGRALHYAPPPGVAADPSKGTFAFQHCELNSFSPDAYLEAIKAADEQLKADVIIVDSFSHEWEGEGGVLEMQDDEFQRLGARDSVKMLSWVKPKRAHKRMVNRLVQCRAHLVIGLRAAEKVKLVKGAGGKQEVIPAAERPVKERWEPICEKNLPFELTASFVLTPTDPGIPVPVKLQDQHKPFFPLDRTIEIECGEKLAAWARGGSAPGSAPASPGGSQLTRGEVRQLEQLIQRAAQENRITPIEVELYERAIADKDAQKVRDGIRDLGQKVAA